MAEVNTEDVHISLNAQEAKALGVLLKKTWASGELDPWLDELWDAFH